MYDNVQSHTHHVQKLNFRALRELPMLGACNHGNQMTLIRLIIESPQVSMEFLTHALLEMTSGYKNGMHLVEVVRLPATVSKTSSTSEPRTIRQP